MTNTLRPGINDPCKLVRRHIARALVGHCVDLMTKNHTIIHGIVTGVFTEEGAPKLVVGGSRYDLNEIVSAIPASLDSQLQHQH